MRVLPLLSMLALLHAEPGVGRAFAAAQASFAQLGDPRLLGAAVGPEAQPRLRADLLDLLRLNAVVARAVVRDKERLLEMFQQARAGRQSLEAMCAPEGSGGRLDFSA